MQLLQQHGETEYSCAACAGTAKVDAGEAIMQTLVKLNLVKVFASNSNLQEGRWLAWLARFSTKLHVTWAVPQMGVLSIWRKSSKGNSKIALLVFFTSNHVCWWPFSLHTCKFCAHEQLDCLRRNQVTVVTLVNYSWGSYAQDGRFRRCFLHHAC